MKTNMYSIEIANIIKQFLTEDSWNFSFDEEHGIFKFGLSDGNGMECNKKIYFRMVVDRSTSRNRKLCEI